jgi:hypothetical protein
MKNEVREGKPPKKGFVLRTGTDFPFIDGSGLFQAFTSCRDVFVVYLAFLALVDSPLL